MLETPHVIVGIAIATKVSNPLLSVPLSLASHFVLDVLPHWNPHINREIKKYGHPTKESVRIITVDSILALGLGLSFAFKSPALSQTANILLCSFASALPDIVEAPYYFLHHKTTIIEKWIAWQKSIQNDAEPFVGLLTQLAIIMAACFWILF
ncbi:hypothetical protein HYS03_01280 [Candidatus Woesebacteria bacterium]|nr:hypothetical protein [Candidatus Woesebacteria bacterium]QQG47292.1 MAG: hypothetical protein HY044_04160 [Candidatus Woesebacteria bacterium]